MTEEEKRAYNKFRTGLTFQDVRQMFWVFDEDPRTWKNVTRHTVLGKWRELKMEMWAQHKPAEYRQEDEDGLLYLQNHEVPRM